MGDREKFRISHTCYYTHLHQNEVPERFKLRIILQGLNIKMCAIIFISCHQASSLVAILFYKLTNSF